MSIDSSERLNSNEFIEHFILCYRVIIYLESTESQLLVLMFYFSYLSIFSYFRKMTNSRSLAM